MQNLYWLGDFLVWLVTPALVPMVGLIAALSAALTVEVKTWYKSTRTFLIRVFRVSLVWLLVAWILGVTGNFGADQGRGERRGNEKSAGDHLDDKSLRQAVTVVPGQMPAGVPEHVDLVIRFVPTATNPTVAQPFACDLFRKNSSQGAVTTKIRAQNMVEFEKLLVQQLRAQDSTSSNLKNTIRVRRAPFPGENALRSVAERIRVVYPGANVEWEE